MLTRVILAVAGGVVAVGTAVAAGRGVAVSTGRAAGARVVGVGADGAAVATGAVVGAGAAGLGVAVAALPQATIIAAIPTTSQSGLSSHLPCIINPLHQKMAVLVVTRARHPTRCSTTKSGRILD